MSEKETITWSEANKIWRKKFDGDTLYIHGSPSKDEWTTGEVSGSTLDETEGPDMSLECVFLTNNYVKYISKSSFTSLLARYEKYYTTVLLPGWEKMKKAQKAWETEFPAIEKKFEKELREILLEAHLKLDKIAHSLTCPACGGKFEYRFLVSYDENPDCLRCSKCRDGAYFSPRPYNE